MNKIKQNQLNYALVEAVNNGFPMLIENLLDKGADLHFNNSQIIINAPIKSNVKNIECIIKRGADIYAQDSQAFIHAVQYGKLDIVRLLVNKGVDVSVRKNIALEIAVSRSIKIQNQFLTNVIDQPNTDMVVAKEMFQYLLKHGASFKDNMRLFKSNIGHNTDLLQALIDSGVKADENDNAFLKDKNVARNKEAIKILVENGGDVTVSSDILNNFIRFGDMEFVIYLAKEIERKGKIQEMLKDYFSIEKNKGSFVSYSDPNSYIKIIQYLVTEYYKNVDFLLEAKSIDNELLEWASKYKSSKDLVDKLNESLSSKIETTKPKLKKV